MIHLIYISSATSWLSEEDLKELLEQARERNKRQNITGMLLYDNATFMQVLEGEEADVHEIYNSIVKDDRNTGQVILIEEAIDERDFPDWSMGFRNLKTCKPEELEGFQDVFNGVLDKEVVLRKKSKVVAMLMRFARLS